MAEEQIPGEPATAVQSTKSNAASSSPCWPAAIAVGRPPNWPAVPSTINRTVAHDPKFADQVAAAELSAGGRTRAPRPQRLAGPPLLAIGGLVPGAEKPRRIRPPPPWTFTQREVAELLVQVMDVTFEGLSDEKVDEALARLGELVQGIQDTRAGFPPRRDAPAGGPPLSPSPVPALPVPLDPDEHGLWDTPAEGSGQ